MKGKSQRATLVSVNIGTLDNMSKQPVPSAYAQLDGFEGDKHRGYSRVCYAGDTEPEGTVRRNNRQWSGMSREELEEIREELNLAQTLTAQDLGINVCIQGIGHFSKLSRGTKLVFPSGAALVVEDYNPPCTEMADKVADLYVSRSGEAVSRRAFLIAAKQKRGVVGVIDVPGIINTGDDIIVQTYNAPKI